MLELGLVEAAAARAAAAEDAAVFVGHAVSSPLLIISHHHTEVPHVLLLLPGHYALPSRMHDYSRTNTLVLTEARSRQPRQPQTQQQPPPPPQALQGHLYGRMFDEYLYSNAPYTVDDQSGAFFPTSDFFYNNGTVAAAAAAAAAARGGAGLGGFRPSLTLGGAGSQRPENGFFSSLFRRTKGSHNRKKKSLNNHQVDDLLLMREAETKQAYVRHQTMMLDNLRKASGGIRTLDRQVHRHRTFQRAANHHADDESSRPLMPDPDLILPKQPWTDFSGREDWHLANFAKNEENHQRLLLMKKKGQTRPESLELDVSTATAMSQLPSAASLAVASPLEEDDKRTTHSTSSTSSSKQQAATAAASAAATTASSSSATATTGSSLSTASSSNSSARR